MVWLDYFKRHSSGTQSSLIWLLLILRPVKSISGWKKPQKNPKHIAYVHLKGMTELLLLSTQYHTVSTVFSEYYYTYNCISLGLFFFIYTYNILFIVNFQVNNSKNKLNEKLKPNILLRPKANNTYNIFSLKQQ